MSCSPIKALLTIGRKFIHKLQTKLLGYYIGANVSGNYWYGSNSQDPVQCIKPWVLRP